jgi:fatty-acyl-CoA synthase
MSARRPENMGSALKAWVRALEATADIEHGQAPVLPVLFDTLAERFDLAPALVAPDATLSFRTLAQAANRYARWGLTQGLAKDDVVCLLMHNCSAYMPIWLGLSRIGVTVSLLNTNLSGRLLAHAIQAVTARGVIVGASLGSALAAARPHLSPALSCWAHGPADPQLPRIDLEAERLPGERLSTAERAAPALGDRALYIYTSGTTGLPKAANVSHFRLMQWSHWFAGLMDTGPTDRMYNCLPMYHSIGGVVATGATLVHGGAVVLRERFSAREFWRDLVRERCTLFQYIGELCRYLVMSPVQPEETQHALRLCCGNGLRAEVWEQFQSRFRIPRILEYYAATEASFSLYNCEGRVGAIGKIPAFLAHRVPVALVKFDLAAGVPWRNAGGFCERCAPKEVGEAIGAVSASGVAHGGRFEGYADAEASQKKILRDVFASGDAWYRTGDLMRQDDQGFFYFIDRVGDTFRWKGENVSTTEVAALITASPGVTEAAVYGVAVPGSDGRAGMAALVVDPQFDLQAFRRHLEALPVYARPLFLRILPAIELTGTFRLRKQELAVQGYDPGEITDELYCEDRALNAYVRLDTAMYERLKAGKLRF